VQSLLEVQGQHDPIPAFDSSQLEDSECVPLFIPVFQMFSTTTKRSTFDAVNEWLSHWISRDDARMIAMDLQSHRNIGQGSWKQPVCSIPNAHPQSLHRIDFPSQIFIEHLFEITQIRFQRLHLNVSNTQHIVPTSIITSSIDSFKEAMRHQQMKLLQTLNLSIRRSPKRGLDSVAPTEQDR